MIETHITGRNVLLIVKDIEQLDAKMIEAAKAGLSRGLAIVAGVAEKQYLHGPRPQRLGVRSGRLSGSITHSVTANSNGVIGRIGSNVVYAAFHEFGFHGTINISAHTRVVESLGEFGDDQDMRRHYRDSDGRFIGYRDTRKRASGRFKHWADRIQFVKAHTRNISYDGKPFVRPAIEVSSQTIGNEIAKEMQAVGKQQ